MRTNDKLNKRVNDLIELANKVLATERRGSGKMASSYVDNELFIQFRNASLSFIINLFGEKHPYYNSFDIDCARPSPFDSKAGRGILLSIKNEIDEGWLDNIKGLVSAEIFTDFIEMAEHLLDENYKDAAAVMIGSVLEEHLRQLCLANQISISNIKNGKEIPKKADLLNAELVKADVYNKLDQKNITANLDLRNKAAHGHYQDYSKEQVELMMRGVMDFMTRNQI